MTGLQLALLAGGLVGAGCATILVGLIPAPPHLADALARLQPTAAHINPPHATMEADLETRIGTWAQRTIPARFLGVIPRQDLNILGRSAAIFYGSRVLLTVGGLFFGSLLAIFANRFLIGFPLVITPAVSLGIAIFCWYIPASELKDQAKRARAECRLALTAYIEMVALERRSGSGTRQALQQASEIGDSWVFDRIAAELGRTRWSGQSPWDALEHLGTEIGVDDFIELADIMRLAGEDGSQVYTQLRARAAGLRSAALNDQVAEANIRGERLAFPLVLLVFVVAATVITPALLRLTS